MTPAATTYLIAARAKHPGFNFHHFRQVGEYLTRQGYLDRKGEVTEKGNAFLASMGLIMSPTVEDVDPASGFSEDPGEEIKPLPAEALTHRQAVARGGRFVR